MFANMPNFPQVSNHRIWRIVAPYPKKNLSLFRERLRKTKPF